MTCDQRAAACWKIACWLAVRPVMLSVIWKPRRWAGVVVIVVVGVDGCDVSE